MHFSVRRDLVHRVSAGDVLPENAVRGRVEGVEYQGTYVKITLAGASEGEFIVNEPEAAFFADPVALGDEVVAHWRPEHVHLLEPDRAAGGGAQPYAEAAG